MNFKNILYNFLNTPHKINLTQKTFSDIYFGNLWGNSESVSGPGSTLERTESFRDEIAHVLKSINAKSLLDAPCGDFNWMRKVNLDIDFYIGIDIVPEIIQNNKKKYNNKNRKFYHRDLIFDSLPKTDVILCRDGLVHFSLKDIKLALKNFKKSKSSYLLTTTFVNIINNSDIQTGLWRPINLEIHPFNLPIPLKLIDEKCHHSNGIYADKRLALWDLRLI